MSSDLSSVHQGSSSEIHIESELTGLPQDIQEPLGAAPHRANTTPKGGPAPRSSQLKRPPPRRGKRAAAPLVATGATTKPLSASSTSNPSNTLKAASSSSIITTTTGSLASPSPSAPPSRSSSASSSLRQLLATKTPSSSSSSSSSIAVTSSQKNVNPPKSKKGRVDEEAEPRKPLVVGLTPTISTITASTVAERERASERKSAALSDTTITPAANGVAETRMISASTGGNLQVPRSVEPYIDGIFLREQMVSLLAGTLPRAAEKRLVIMLRTATGQGRPDQRALKLGLWQGAGVISYEMEDNPILLYPEDNWWVTWAGEDDYVVLEKKGRGFPSIFKLRNLRSPEDWRVLLEHRDPPPGVFHCRTNSHWLLYYCGGEPEFYIEPALLPPPQIGGSPSSPLKVQQEDLGLLEGHVISFVTLSKREPHVALLISLKMSPTISPTEHQIIFWNVKKSLESKRLHEIERWPVTGAQALPHETISMAFVIRSGSSDYDLGDDAVVVAKSSTSRVYVIKRNSAVPHLVQSAGCEARNLFRIGNGTKFCVTYDGRYEVRDVNTPEEVLMTVDTTGTGASRWNRNNRINTITNQEHCSMLLQSSFGL
ncbi:hypothetical protein Pelo_2400 [Pelomyxa schiedti]|nr:hypothetical protein Pelo_2400 [Pelomyxa schiedti]